MPTDPTPPEPTAPEPIAGGEPSMSRPDAEATDPTPPEPTAGDAAGAGDGLAGASGDRRLGKLMAAPAGAVTAAMKAAAAVGDDMEEELLEVAKELLTP